jgi:hypothetical protein
VDPASAQRRIGTMSRLGPTIHYNGFSSTLIRLNPLSRHKSFRVLPDDLPL